MSPSHLTLQNLERALELVKKGESIQGQIDQINDQLVQFGKGNAEILLPGHQTTEVSPELKRRRYRHRSSQVVLKVLQRAGAKGLTVRELALLTKIKTTSLRTWLYTKAKSMPEIRKLKPGLFAYHAS
jgi:hypothetical protein